MWSDIKSLDKLRSDAAASGTGCILVSIEELNVIKNEIDVELKKSKSQLLDKIKHQYKDCKKQTDGNFLFFNFLKRVK